MKVQRKVAFVLFAGSIVLTVVCFMLGFPFFFLFLFFPMLLFFPGRRPGRVCPVCGVEASDDSKYCRVCGAKLEEH
ncbi:MAG TPA: zinc-ribbon domain-containing protein [Methanocorpusculum sp.]|nr:zinc-ribbon domain-containing protein [Methanocorpusculum sp.]